VPVERKIFIPSYLPRPGPDTTVRIQQTGYPMQFKTTPGDLTFATGVEAETAARIAADNAEQVARIAADNTERAERIAADNTLQANINAVAVAQYVRIRTVSTTLNNTVPNGGLLQFDTVDFDSSGFTPVTMPFNTVTVPVGLDGIYIFAGWSSGSGNQSTTLGMGLLINSSQRFSQTNQSISGPGSVNYTLDNGAVEIIRLVAGDTIQLVNNSVSGGTNVFTSTSLSMARIGVEG
jgi:hypothetical protein